MPQGTFLFLGDNFIADNDWQKRMPLFEVHNLGTPEEKVDGLLNRLSHLDKEKISPNIILVMTGIQNVIDEDYTFVDQIKRIIIGLSNSFPEAEIIINSLPSVPVKLAVDNAIEHLNQNIREIASQTGCCYLDNFVVLAQGKSKIFQKNKFTLTSKAYDQWARSILEFVAFLYEDD